MNKDVDMTDNPIKGNMERSLLTVGYGRPFRRSDLKRSFLAKKKIDRKHFINILNYHNFMNTQVFAFIQYPNTKEEFLFSIQPGPCRGDLVSCSAAERMQGSMDAFEIRGIIVDNGDTVVVMEVEPVDRTPISFTARIKKSATMYQTRQVKRHPCIMVEAIIKFAEKTVYGSLREFHPSGLRIEVKKEFSREIELLKPGDKLTAYIIKDGERIYSGIAKLIRVELSTNIIVLNPLNTLSSKYEERKYRNTRLSPVPSPRVAFEHPLIARRVVYDIIDLNTSGFSIAERSERVLFIPGMVFRSAEIIFSEEISLRCSAKVIYGRKQWGGMTKFGFAITDMDPITYTRLFNLLTRTDDPHSIASSKVSMDALWEFFFSSGFIYPDKYRYINEYKDTFRKIYEHLYHHCPEIFSSLTYQRNDQIYGHVSIIKAYPSTWMVHHLAALPMGRKRTGLYVLNQILNYLDGFHRMPSIGMKYLVFYYRPENKFPNYFFGGVCRILNAPHMCSVDEFAYILHILPTETKTLPVGWDLCRCTREDFAALHNAYRNHSPGLMIEAFDLENHDKSLWNTYKKLGLKRECSTYMLTHDGDRMAFFIVDRSERGLNLSDLLNSIKIIIPHIDHKMLPWHILEDVITLLGKEYNTDDVVLQVFPSAFLDAAGVNYPKKYCMWIAKTKYFDPHFDAIKRMTKFKYIKFIKSLIESMLSLH